MDNFLSLAFPKFFKAPKFAGSAAPININFSFTVLPARNRRITRGHDIIFILHDKCEIMQIWNALKRALAICGILHPKKF